MDIWQHACGYLVQTVLEGVWKDTATGGWQDPGRPDETSTCVIVSSTPNSQALECTFVTAHLTCCMLRSCVAPERTPFVQIMRDKEFITLAPAHDVTGFFFATAWPSTIGLTLHMCASRVHGE